jgi:hypothetical protein
MIMMGARKSPTMRPGNFPKVELKNAQFPLFFKSEGLFQEGVPTKRRQEKNFLKKWKAVRGASGLKE